MRLIDADALIRQLDTQDYSGAPETLEDWTPQDMTKAEIADIQNAPTIEAVEVVRCKDCRWGREVCGNIECSVDCNLPPEYHGYEWFCPNGERRNDETN